ncbi:hypothetical protein BD94_1681 [Elizabethkingia anophelis NUHP1]|uniref:Uncharacterized protein n=1 Tax=Elizabethkingia anophelis NUHP1 TaxID=1338011 RepID=A0A077ED42_9FLAO|nr:hypothetical protein BD94_1681 [Elizabethkingia anophelis NUHP1]
MFYKIPEKKMLQNQIQKITNEKYNFNLPYFTKCILTE